MLNLFGYIPRPLGSINPGPHNLQSSQKYQIGPILPEIMNGRLSEPAISDTSLLAAGLFISWAVDPDDEVGIVSPAECAQEYFMQSADFQVVGNNDNPCHNGTDIV